MTIPTLTPLPEHSEHHQQQLLLGGGGQHHSTGAVFQDCDRQIPHQQHHCHQSAGHEAGTTTGQISALTMSVFVLSLGTNCDTVSHLSYVVLFPD